MNRDLDQERYEEHWVSPEGKYLVCAVNEFYFSWYNKKKKDWKNNTRKSLK